MPKKKQVLYDDILFDSKEEVKDYKYIMEHPNIELIELQPRFHLMDSFSWFDIEKGKERKSRVMVYTPDFKVKVKGLDKLVIWERK